MRLPCLVGEKLLHHVSAAAKHPEFSAQLPMFIAEIRRIFDPGVFARELPKLAAKLAERARRDAEFDDGLPSGAQVELEALKMVSDLLTAQQLGTA